MTLFEIEKSHRETIEELIDNGGALSPELEAKMQFDLESFERKMQGYGLAIKELNGEVDLLADAIAELQKKKKAREQTIETMKGRMLQAMLVFEKEKFKTPMVSIWIGRSKKLRVINDQVIPAAFLREVIEYKVEAAKLKEAIESGAIQTDGAVVEEALNFQVR